MVGTDSVTAARLFLLEVAAVNTSTSDVPCRSPSTRACQRGDTSYEGYTAGVLAISLASLLLPEIRISESVPHGCLRWSRRRRVGDRYTVAGSS